MSLVREYINLQEPYNQDIKEQVTTILFFKKRRQSLHEIPNPRGKLCKRCFSNSIPCLCSWLFKQYINNPGQGQWEKKLTWLDLWNLFTINFPLCMIWSLVLCKTSHRKNCPKFLPPCKTLFWKRFPHTLQGGRGDTMSYLQTFPISKISSLTSVVHTMTFQAKLPTHCIQHTIWFRNFPNCFKPELQNHVAKDIKLGDKFVTNF